MVATFRFALAASLLGGELASAFAPLSVPARISSPLHATTTANDNSNPLVNAEISRRVALVTAAALAAGASPATAASLEKKVTLIEKKNIKEVNTKGAPEKHLPQVSIAKNTVTVVVPHVMDPDKPHFIEYVWLKDMKTWQVTAVQAFQATDPSPPTLVADDVAPGTTVKPMLYCNLHGLWEGDAVSV